MRARYELRNIGVFDTEFGIELRRGDPGWPDYERWLATPGNVLAPMPPPPPEPPPQYNYAAAAAAREERIIRRIAADDPVAALKRKEGWK